MDCVSPILDFLSNRSRDLFSLVFGHVVSLEETIRSLKREMHQLKSMRDDVKREVTAAERQRLNCTNQVRWWLESVDALGSEAASIDADFQRLFRCFGDCPLNVCSRYQLGKRAAEKLAETRDLMSKGVFSKVADELLLGKIEEVPITSSVGVDLMLEQLHEYVRGDEVGIVGLHGMGGVGKTNLMKKFNNELLCSTHDFEMVMLIEVSKDLNVERIQRAVGSRLGLRWNENEDQTERATHIFTVLSKMKFVIFLDDIWEPLYLPLVGIPIPNGLRRWKIILSTRIEDVCTHMDAQKIMKVKCLPWEEAWDLFLEKSGKEFIISHAEVEVFAKAIVTKSGGLPLALTAIGRAMASKRTLEEWEHAFGAMLYSPWELPSMEEIVFPCLKSSYDNLHSDKLKACFLYCSLYPEEFPIEKAWLIDYWLCEGILDFGYAVESSGKGHEIIGMLKAACLLDDDKGKVKMHGMMRNLALWLASECGKKKNKWLVQAGIWLTRAPENEKWKVAERISLMDNKIGLWPDAPDCPNLVSLMLHHNSALRKFPSGFFQFMPSLTVLELSLTSIEELPSGIGMLRELRYLNLWQTKLISLPNELGDLAKLKYLELGWTPTLRFIPEGVIGRLSATLNMLGVFNTRIDWKVGGSSGGGGVFFEELEGLKQLKSLGISVGNVPALQRLAGSHHLAKSTTRLHVYECEGMKSIQVPSTLGGSSAAINMLTITDSGELEEVIIGCDGGVEWSLTNLQILEIRNLAQAKIFWRGLLPCECPQNLRFLWITSCPGIEKLADGAAFAFAIAKILEIHLTDLPELKNICGETPLTFPSLQFLVVDRCPKLKKLPFGSCGDANNLIAISGQKEWWDGLEWEDDTIKSYFQLFFKELHPQV